MRYWILCLVVCVWVVAAGGVSGERVVVGSDGTEGFVDGPVLGLGKLRLCVGYCGDSWKSSHYSGRRELEFSPPSSSSADNEHVVQGQAIISSEGGLAEDAEPVPVHIKSGGFLVEAGWGVFDADQLVETHSDEFGRVEHMIVLQRGPDVVPEGVTSLRVTLSPLPEAPVEWSFATDGSGDVVESDSGVSLTAPVVFDGNSKRMDSFFELPERARAESDNNNNNDLSVVITVSPGQTLVYPIVIDPVATTPAWSLAGTQRDEMFGHRIAVGDVNNDGNHDIVIGSPLYDTTRGYDAGRVTIVEGTSGTFATSASGTLELPSTATADWFATQRSGFGVGVALGDSDGDGYDEILVGASGTNAQYNNPQGAAFLYDDDACVDSCASGCSTTVTSNTVVTTVSNSDWILLEGGSSFSYPHVVGTGVDYRRVDVTETLAPSSSETKVETIVSTTYTATSGSSTSSACEWNPGAFATFGLYPGESFAWYWGWDNFPSTAVTVDFWYRGVSTSSTMTMFSYTTSSSATTFTVRRPGSLTVVVRGSSYNSGLAVNDGAWHHVSVAWSRSPGSVRVIVDGTTSATSGNIQTNSLATNGALLIGAQLDRYDYRRTDGPTYVLDGSMASIRIWNTRRDDVATVRASIGCPVSTGSPPAGLVAQWDFDAAEVYASNMGIRDAAFGTKLLGVNSGVTLTGSEGFPPRTPGGANPVAVNMEMATNVTTVTTVTTCTAGCGSGAPCKWHFLQASSPGVDTTSGGNVGCAVSFGNIDSGSAGEDAIVGRHMRSTRGNVYTYRDSSNFGGSTGRTIVANPQSGQIYKEGNGLFGQRVEGRFDVVGDSLPDLIASAPRSSLPKSSGGIWYQGAVHVFAGGNGVATTPTWSANGPQTNCGFGSGLGVADVNNDGNNDLIIGARYHLTTFANDGAIFVFLGDGAGSLSATPDQTIVGTQIYGMFGSAVTSIGDLDKDGCEDIAVGAPGVGDDSQGAVYIFLGCSGASSGLLSPVAEQQILGSSPRGSFGHHLEGGFDIDGDTWNDLLVAEPFWSSMLAPETDVGRVVLLAGLPIADLSITSFTGPVAPVNTPDPFAVTVVVNNGGSASATGMLVEFEYEITTGVTLTSSVGTPALTGACTDVAHPTKANTRVATCPCATLADAGNQQITFTFGATSLTPSATLSYTVSASATEVDKTPDSATTSAELVARVDLSATLLTQPTSVFLGEPITFEVRVSAAGGFVTANGVQLSSNMPTDAYEYLSISGTTNEPGESVVCFSTSICSVPRLSPGNEFTVTYSLRVLNGISALLVADELIQSFEASTLGSFEVNAADNVVSSNAFPIVEACNLFAVFLAQPTNLAAGGVTSVTASFSNNGRVACASVQATIDFRGAGFQALSVRFSEAGLSCSPLSASTGVMTCDVPQVGVGVAPKEISITLRVPSSRVETTVATLNTTLVTDDIDPSNNDASLVLTTFFSADSKVDVIPFSGLVTGVPFVPGSPGLWNVVVRALGPSDSSSVTVEYGFIPQSGLTASSISLGTLPGSVSCTPHPTEANVTCTVSGIEATGDSRTNFVAIPLQVTAGFDTPTMLSVATISSPRDDPDLTNNVASADQVINKNAEINISPFVPSAVLAGTVSEVTPRVTNLGPNTATDIVITVELPQPSTYVGYTWPTGTCTFAVDTVTCTTVTPLAAGQVIELTVNFIPQFLGTNSLTASVSQSRPEADLSDNTAVVPFNTVEQADLAAFLTLRGSSPARITRGSVEVYQAKVRNNGFSASADVQTVFTVPSNGVLELVEGGAGNTTCGPLDEALRTVTCTTFPGYRMPASTEVLTLASFTVLFPSDLNVTVVVNGTEMVANVTATVELSSLSVLDAQLDNNIASLTIPAGFASADIGVATVDGKDKSSFSWVTSSGAVRTGSRLAGRLSAFNYGPFPGAGVVIEIRAPGSAIFGNTPPSVVVDSGGSASSVIGFVTCAENGFTPERTTLECTVASFPNGAILAIDVGGTVTAVTNETVTFEAEVVASALPDPDTSNDMASFTAKIEPSVSEDGETAFVAPPNSTSSGLGWLLWLIIILGIALVLFFVLGAFGFFKRKKPPTDSEIEAAKAEADMEMDGIDSDEILDGGDDGGGAEVAEL